MLDQDDLLLVSQAAVLRRRQEETVAREDAAWVPQMSEPEVAAVYPALVIDDHRIIALDFGVCVRHRHRGPGLPRVPRNVGEV